MNNQTRLIPSPLTLAAALCVASISGTLVASNQNNQQTEQRYATAKTVAASEPLTKEAVASAIEQYVRARYAGDVETVKSRAHHDIARRAIADNYWGQPSKEWVRPYTQDQLGFYGDPNGPQRMDNPESGRCDIAVFDIEQQTASARVIMEDVVDYLHMIYVDGRWLIGDSAVIILDEPGERVPALSQRHKEAVTEVSRDYCVGFYQTDGDKVQSTCHPSLSKRSVEHAKLSNGETFDYLSQITWEEINILGQTFNTHWGFDDTARCEIEIYEIRGDIAAAKMTGSVWFDYFHLMRVNGEWSIVNIMYESLDKSRWTDV
ncbi:MAG: nuclear transport factor 2 family protein [Phycisphaerales bacterium]